MSHPRADDSATMLDQVAERLERAREVLLTSHITPDADGLGTAIALLRHLRRLGKRAMMVNCSAAPSSLRWIYDSGEFLVFVPGQHESRVQRADVIVATDLGGSARLGRMLEPIRAAQATRVVIDHHHYENDLFDLPLIDMRASSSAELAYRLLQHMGAEMDASIAEPLYAGVVSDTGNFSFPGTKPSVHRMAAHLLECGVDPHVMWRRLSCQVPMAKMRFLGQSLTRMEFLAQGKIAHLAVRTQELRDGGIHARDAFEVVNHLLLVKGVEVGVFFLEIDDQQTKVSLRSQGKVDVAALARRHGGGGHPGAAGCTVKAPGIDGARELVIAELEAALRPETEWE